ncbi:hypothetical protein E2P81_ATG09464 [Venturia nashicola]|nr:hypothetical protein E2P81_ATG09464 [Venturia nashicola]
MSSSPPKKGEAEEGEQSPQENTEQGTGQGPMDPSDTQGQGTEVEVKEQDRWLPIANGPAQTVNLQRKQRAIMSSSSPSDSTSPVQRPSSSKDSSNNRDSDANIRNFAPVARIMKSALPENAKIAKEAKECMQECVSEFISFITSEASEKCQQEKRKTVNGEDILFAMTSLGFENYSEALKIYLARYRETLLASQKSTGPSGTAGGGTNNSAAGGNASAAAAFAEGTNDALLADGLDDATTGYDPSFAAPHNGNGSADY